MKQTIKRDARREAKRTLRLMKNNAFASISIAVDVTTKEVLAAGVNHSIVLKHLEAPEGSWEMKEVRFWA